jgi:hypothetical protein
MPSACVQSHCGASSRPPDSPGSAVKGSTGFHTDTFIGALTGNARVGFHFLTYTLFYRSDVQQKASLLPNRTDAGEWTVMQFLAATRCLATAPTAPSPGIDSSTDPVQQADG